MYSYLSQHPDVFLPAKKEIPFFGSDMRIEYRIDGHDFHEHFRGADRYARAGTAWVQYLRSETAPSEIRAYAPDGDVIVMLRNPVDMLHALHSQNRFELLEDLADFGEALSAEDERKQGRRLPPRADRGVYPLEALFYRDQARYAAHLRRYFSVFGREKVHVIIFDDFASDTRSAFRSTLNFLGVDASFEPDFPVVYSNKRPRSQLVQGLLLYTPKPMLRAARLLLPHRVRHGLVEANTIYERRAPMDPSLRASLISELANEVEELSALLDKDLTHWVTDQPDEADGSRQ